MRKIFEEKIQDAAESCRVAATNMYEVSEKCAELQKLLADIPEEFGEDISYFFLWGDVAEFSLKEDCKSSKLPHEIAKALGVTLEKKKGYDEQSLYLEAKVPKSDLTIRVSGYLPQTCEVVYDEVPIPESEIVRVRKKARVVCHSVGETQEETNEALAEV